MVLAEPRWREGQRGRPRRHDPRPDGRENFGRAPGRGEAAGDADATVFISSAGESGLEQEGELPGYAGLGEGRGFTSPGRERRGGIPRSLAPRAGIAPPKFV